LHGSKCAAKIHIHVPLLQKKIAVLSPFSWRIERMKMVHQQLIQQCYYRITTAAVVLFDCCAGAVVFTSWLAVAELVLQL
jgi:hypothetical protein